MSAPGDPFSSSVPVQDDTPPPPPPCSCSSTAVTSVFVTLLILLVIEAGLYVLWKIYWRGKKGQHLVLVTDSEKGDLYAYDNPGFKEGPSLVPVVAKETPSTKTKWDIWASGLVPNGNIKVKAMDDSFSSGPVVRVVPLRSRDFTGLGFNICGNMRDGVFIKDVLHRGPASESGHIYPGDRLESVKVCLKHVVLEDALTILSYASPYDVELGVSSPTGNVSSRHPPAPRSIAHPFYKSHSISDLQQIEKSSSRRSAEKSVNDAAEPKMSTLEKRSKQEAERYQNTKNCIIESVQKQENIFHTIELDEPDRKESSSPSNVKAMLVKGIQNLKEKLHNSLHQDDERGSSGNPSRCSTLDKRGEARGRDEGFRSVELSVPEDKDNIKVIPFGGGIETDEVERKRKGKAPTPPQVESGIPVVTLSSDNGDCIDSDNETVGERIELDSSHVTVHQAEGEGRKASSLGDLSRYEGDKLTVLERAVSLDLADGGGRKRKAPLPPQELTPYKEAEPASTGTLKKSNVWGTLEDALKDSDSESELDESGCSSPVATELTSANACSTPITNLSVPSPPITNINVEDSTIAQVASQPEMTASEIATTSFNLSHTEQEVPDPPSLPPIDQMPMDWHQSTTSINGNGMVNGNSSSGGSTPPLPTSPIPDFITEIEILTDRLNESNSIQALDSFQASYSTCREVNSPELDNYKPISFETEKPIMNGSSSKLSNMNHESVSLKRVLDTIDDSKDFISNAYTSVIEESELPKRMKSFGTSLDDLESPKKIMTTFKNDTNTAKKSLDFSLDESYRIQGTNKENDKPLGTFSTFKVEPKQKEDGESSLANKILRNEVPEKKFSIVEIETDSSPPPPTTVEVTKPPRNVSVTSIKTSSSRIPVRAGQRSPGSGKHSPELRRVSDNRNGHHSP